jgi:hypothetical protein
MRKVLCSTLALGILAAIPAIASADPIHPRDHQVIQREHKQENRIYSGVRNGSLSPREYDRLQNREARLNAQRAQEFRANGGHLTRAQQAQLNREENGLSRSIYRDKHN